MMEQQLQQGIIMREPHSNGDDAGEDGSLQVGLLSAEVQPRLQFQLRRREWCSRGCLIFGVLMFTFSAVYLILLSGRSYNILQTAAPLNILVVGDWGRDGLFNQTLVAKQMGIVGSKLNIDYVISTGDNFYESGLTGPDDTQFTTSFSDVYTQESLQTTWYSVLGNHDYRGNATAQLAKELTLRDSRWFCRETTGVEFFFIDTNPFVESYWVENNKDYIWQLPISRQDYIAHELMNLTDALETSKAKWKIVVGHHTMWSVGKHGETHELLTEVLPILEANGVDMYINGHDHCLQHIKRSDSSLHFLTSGGGSKAWRGRGTNKDKDTGLQFYYDGQGFAAVSMTPSLFHMDFYDISGNILHSLDLSKD
ncbi:unnamed protein product [Sphagnum troendelagicum]|uniref:Purple acid phosphatase n=1 Tax=Sphagnum troendelagicum TaxID=128251 RepID=A0ABP0TEE7_9BRYO